MAASSVDSRAITTLVAAKNHPFLSKPFAKRLRLLCMGRVNVRIVLIKKELELKVKRNGKKQIFG